MFLLSEDDKYSRYVNTKKMNIPTFTFDKLFTIWWRIKPLKIRIGYILKSAEVGTLVSRRYSENSSHTLWCTLKFASLKICMTNFMIPKKNNTYLVTKYFKLISQKIISMFFSTVCTCYTSVKYECHTLCLKKTGKIIL